MRTNRILSLLLTAALLLALCPAFAPTASAAIGIEAGQPSTIVAGDKVYFGKYPQTEITDISGLIVSVDFVTHSGKHFLIEPIEWRVLSNGSGELFLLSEKNLDGGKPYHTAYNPITWERSTIRSWLNGYGASANDQSVDYSSDNFLDTAFGAEEQAAILTANVVNSDNGSIPGGNDTNDQIFLLSLDEVQKTAYGFPGDNNPNQSRVAGNTAYAVAMGASNNGGNGIWWLRSPGISNYLAAVVHADGYVYFNGDPVNVDHIYVARPAFNLDLSSVIFTSDASATSGKSAATAGSGLIPAQPVAQNLKLTVLDASLSLNCTDTALRTVRVGDTVDIAYTGAISGANKYVSCVIVNSSGNVLFYGKLMNCASGNANGIASFTVPALANGNYTIKLFNEECNGDFETDFASNPVLISITVNNPDADTDNYSPTFTRRTLTDIPTGVQVTAGMDMGARLHVTANTLHPAGCKACDEIRARQQAGDVLALYDISLTGYHTGAYDVFIPFSGSGYFTVLHCNKGVLEQRSGLYANGGITTTWAKLSPFAVVRGADIAVPDTVVLDPPKTGDAGSIGGFVMMLIGLCGLVGLRVARRRKLKIENS